MESGGLLLPGAHLDWSIHLRAKIQAMRAKILAINGRAI